MSSNEACPFFYLFCWLMTGPLNITGFDLLLFILRVPQKSVEVDLGEYFPKELIDFDISLINQLCRLGLSNPVGSGGVILVMMWTRDARFLAIKLARCTAIVSSEKLATGAKTLQIEEHAALVALEF